MFAIKSLSTLCYCSGIPSSQPTFQASNSLPVSDAMRELDFLQMRMLRSTALARPVSYVRG